MPQLNEELIAAWTRLTAAMESCDLVQGLSFNEALVCGLLSRGHTTASSLCARTGILKSQMNAILRSLEQKGVITRSTDAADRRKQNLAFLPEGWDRYQESHRHTLSLADQLIHSLGEENSRTLMSLLLRAAYIFDKISMEER